MNSVNPPVRFCRSRVRTMCLAQCTGCSMLPNMIVMLDLSPTEWAVSWALEPLAGGDLVRAQDLADGVVEDLRCGAGQRREAGVLHPAQVGLQRLAEPAGALGDLQRGEPVHVHRRHRGLHGLRDVEVVVAVEVGMDAALQAHLGGAELSGLADPVGDLVVGEQVGLAAQVQRQRALGESAERALERAHVGVVDVAVAHEGDVVADDLLTQPVGELRDRHDLRPPCLEQRDELVDSRLLAELDAGQHLGDRSACMRGGPARARSGSGRRRSTRRSSGGRPG